MHNFCNLLNAGFFMFHVGMIAGTLIHQFLAVDGAREETKSNVAMRKYHEDIFSDLVKATIKSEIT